MSPTSNGPSPLASTPIAEGPCIFCERVRTVAEFQDLVIFEDRRFLVSHQIGDDGTKALGVLHFQLKRHVPSFGELDLAESSELGPLLARVSHALERCTGALWTYCFGFTEGPRHVQLVLAARYAHLPAAYLRLRVAEWPQGPRGDRNEVAALCARMREDLAASAAADPALSAP